MSGPYPPMGYQSHTLHPLISCLCYIQIISSSTSQRNTVQLFALALGSLFGNINLPFKLVSYPKMITVKHLYDGSVNTEFKGSPTLLLFSAPETAGEVLSRVIWKMGGKKSLGHKWQWRRVVILIESKLRYWDAKTDNYRGELNIEGAECGPVAQKDEAYSRLCKLKRPKVPEGFVDIAIPGYFFIRPKDSPKTYYFAVPQNEIHLWTGYLRDAMEGMRSFREALRLKHGTFSTPSVASASSSMLGNLKPIGNSTHPLVQSVISVHTNSASSTSTSSGDSSSDFELLSGRSWASVGSSPSGTISSSRSYATSSSTEQIDSARINTFEGGTMPSGHSASEPPPARSIIIRTNLPPSERIVGTSPASMPTQYGIEGPSSSSPIGLAAPGCSGTTTIDSMPMPIIFSSHPQASRDSFVFDS